MSYKLNDYSSFFSPMGNANEMQKSFAEEEAGHVPVKEQVQQQDVTYEAKDAPYHMRMDPTSLCLLGQPVLEVGSGGMRNQTSETPGFPVDLDFSLAPSFQQCVTNRAKSMNMPSPMCSGESSYIDRNLPSNTGYIAGTDEICNDTGMDLGYNPPELGLSESAADDARGQSHDHDDANKPPGFEFPQLGNEEIASHLSYSAAAATVRSPLSVEANVETCPSKTEDGAVDQQGNQLQQSSTSSSLSSFTASSFQSIYPVIGGKGSDSIKNGFSSPATPNRSQTPNIKQETGSPFKPSKKEPTKQRPAVVTESSVSTPLSQPHSGRPRVKSAHNVIEQRYRNKINDKFNALQESVPTLKILVLRKHQEKMRLKQQRMQLIGDDVDEYDSSEGDEMVPFGDQYNNMSFEDIDLEGLEPARKLNKGTILAKSIEYIKFLEEKNSRMQQDHDELVVRAKEMGFEMQ
ncbi:uncharacterized protein LODBEIA_P57030 [Lodderomyces beijingensis]|uniref:BHLH domain-containing protein n=1 Tax=Lodderomyces beijingensis TaxID=1775926 RepID=A0ABP0ZFQ8_9ASCO